MCNRYYTSRKREQGKKGEEQTATENRKIRVYIISVTGS
jgi:hypothetical protein